MFSYGEPSRIHSDTYACDAYVLHAYTTTRFGATPGPNLRPVCNGVARWHYLQADDYNQQPYTESKTGREKPPSSERERTPSLSLSLAVLLSVRASGASRHVTAITTLFVGTCATV